MALGRFFLVKIAVLRGFFYNFPLNFDFFKKNNSITTLSTFDIRSLEWACLAENQEKIYITCYVNDPKKKEGILTVNKMF